VITDIHVHEHEPDADKVEAELGIVHDHVSYLVRTESKRVRTQGSPIWHHGITSWNYGDDHRDGHRRLAENLPDDVAAEAYGCLEGSRWS
jgi:hypothetical protein